MIGKIRPVGEMVTWPSRPEQITTRTFTRYFPHNSVHLFVNSGTAALSLAIKLAVKKKGVSGAPEIILPAYGCPDLVAAAIKQNVKSVLVDFVSNRPWMDHDAVERAITENTVAVLAPHLLGIRERIGALSELCKRNNIPLIEDSAQVFPQGGEMVSDFLILSFGRGKPVNLMGGGCLIVRDNDSELLVSLQEELDVSDVSYKEPQRLKAWLFNFLIHPFVYSILEKLPFLSIGDTRYHPLTDLVRLQYFEPLLELNYSRFTDKNLSSQNALSKVLSSYSYDLIDLPFEVGVLGEPLLRYPIICRDSDIRNRLLSALNKAGIGASAMYGVSLPSMEDVNQRVAFDVYTHADAFSASLLTLPVHSCVSESHTEIIESVLKGFFKR